MSSSSWSQFGCCDSVCDVLQRELKGKIVEDSEAVKGRLGYGCVSLSFVEACLEALKRSENQSAIDNLKQAAAIQESDDRLEKYMCGQLAIVFDTIASLGKPGLFNRRWISNFERVADSIDSKDDSNFDDFQPTAYPDPPNFALGTFVPNEVASWIKCDAVASIHPHNINVSGRIDKHQPISPALAHCANSARLHLAERPFQLYSVGLIITGDTFRVAIFDHDGAVFTESWNMWEDLGVLVRFVRQLTTSATPIQLGEDPTVQPLLLSAQNPLRSMILDQAKKFGLSDDLLEYPSYRVSCNHPATQVKPGYRQLQAFSSTEWVTIGPPIWVSVPLFGRGSSIWRVMRISDKFVMPHEVCILKNTWRSNRRVPESDVYRTENFQAKTTAAVQFVRGGDVHFIDSTAAISTFNLRSKSLWSPLGAPSHSSLAKEHDFKNIGQATSILHRLVLKTTGRPLWEFNNYHQLLLGFRAALMGHQELWLQGILHGDISPGNIMLSGLSTPNPGEEAFLVDIEHSYLRHLIERKYQAAPHGSHNQANRAVSLAWAESQRDGIMTSDVQFMAVEKLALILGRAPPELSTEHQVYHELESFLWAFSYAVIRHLMSENRLDSRTRDEVSTWFNESFGKLTVREVMAYRLYPTPFDAPRSVREMEDPELFPIAIQGLFGFIKDELLPRNWSRGVGSVRLSDIQRLPRQHPKSSRHDVERLTHAILLEAIDTAVYNLREEMAQRKDDRDSE
ncbi:hypothetical protein HGRIS_012417 [Hohenbuehelia grisea]|uniref:Fungal-type protein kinase domain-containing protein n=1 Tax=Hohenbuehelia grisea TaxID=104357 RepID=A0ABR3ISB0_9AGAR